MNKFFKPTAFKIILALVLVLIWFLGPIFYGRIAVNESFQHPSGALTTINYVNSATEIIFYPVKFIFNVFTPQNFILESLSSGAYQFIIFLSSIAFLMLVITEAYLIICVVFWLFPAFKEK